MLEAGSDSAAGGFARRSLVYGVGGAVLLSLQDG